MHMVVIDAKATGKRHVLMFGRFPSLSTPPSPPVGSVGNGGVALTAARQPPGNRNVRN